MLFRSINGRFDCHRGEINCLKIREKNTKEETEQLKGFIVSRIQLLTSKISHICQEICDIKSRRKPQTYIAIQNYTNTGLVEGQTSRNYTRVPDNNNFAKEGSDDGDGLGETYFSHSKQCHRAPNNPDNPSHCHGMTFSNLSFYHLTLSFVFLGLNLFLFLLLSFSWA